MKLLFAFLALYATHTRAAELGNAARCEELERQVQAAATAADKVCEQEKGEKACDDAIAAANALQAQAEKLRCFAR